MRFGFLKKIRVVISLLFFIAISLIFLDFRNIIPPEITGYILFLQFVPSLIKFISSGVILSLGFIFVLLLTFLFGRVYCSSICPLGTFQDIINYLSKKFRRKKRFKFRKPHNLIRYSLLIITVLFYLGGSLIAVNFFDPYSNFGKIFSSLFRPVLIFLNNLLVNIFETFDQYYLFPYDLKNISMIILIFPIFFLTLIALFSFNNGRLYCNSVCPVGSLLGLLSKLSLFKIAIDKNECKGCGICERVCKANCIDSKGTKEIDIARCVSCFNCLTVCPSDGISFNQNAVIKKDISINESKRNFISGILIYIAGSSVVSFAQNKIIPKKKSKIPIIKKYPVSPPGSGNIEHFTNSCTACHLCVSTCPTQVLQPSFLEYGFTGMLQPRMDYSKSFCNFDCTLCTEMCPTAAITPIPLAQKKTSQLGIAKFIEKNCIVYTENTDCGACSEHCPTKAVSMVSYKKLFIPKVLEEFCIGCGACEYACPVKPYKAIYVEGNPIHLIAKKPEIKKIEQKVDYQEDFPF